MNRIDQIFKENKKILSIYFTAGFPVLNDTALILNELHKAGVGMVEIGIPFSDPLADGPVIQHSDEVALSNGMSLGLLFDQLESCIIRDSKTAFLLMGYLNPVLQFGFEKFCKRTKEVGISGFIIPDLPLDMYLKDFKKVVEKYNLRNIFLITPQTSGKRIRYIDGCSKGFIYMVSSSSTTGVKRGIGSEKEKYFRRIKKMELNNPLMVGFGIGDRQSFEKACEFANGAIIGSAFIERIAKSNNLKKDIPDFIKSIR